MTKIKLLAMLGVCGLMLAACGEESVSTDSTETEASSAEESSVVEESKEESSEEVKEDGDFVENASDAYFDGTILKGNTYSVKITDYKVIPAGEPGNEYGENPVIAFWYDTIVSPDYNSETPIDPNTAWIMNFTAVQDNDPNMVNELNIGMLPDDQYTDSQMAEIKPGGTVSNAMAYELTDTETPVTLTAGSLFGDDFGSFDYDLK